MTKKLCSACLMLLMVFSFASCQSGNGEGTASTAQTTQAVQTKAASTEMEPEPETTRSTKKRRWCISLQPAIRERLHSFWRRKPGEICLKSSPRIPIRRRIWTITRMTAGQTGSSRIRRQDRRLATICRRWNPMTCCIWGIPSGGVPIPVSLKPSWTAMICPAHRCTPLHLRRQYH